MPKIHLNIKTQQYSFTPKVERCCIRCKRTKCIQRHHVTYEPKYIVDLCVRCHRLITTINAVVARLFGRKLDEWTRSKIWEIFLTIRNEDWPLII